jgi:hypothetical protein
MINEPLTFFYPSPELITQYCTFHMARVVDVKDPEGRGRIRVEVPGLLSEGKENWTDWLDVGGTSIGGIKDSDGDEGIWWPMQVGQVVLVGFISGDPFVLWAIPGPPCQRGKGKNKQLIPREAKIAGKDNPRDTTRVRQIKSEAGHTVLFDDRGKKEKMMLVDWTGAGLFTVCPGKEADEEEKEGEESKRRKGPRRKMKTIVTKSSEKPGKLLMDGNYTLGLLDMIGSGLIEWCSDEQGMVAVFARNKDGEIKASALADAANERFFITAGRMQIQVLGKENKIAVTRQIIQQCEKIDVESVIEQMAKGLKDAFEEFKDEEGQSDQGSGGMTV